MAKIKIQADIKAPIETVWEKYTNPEDVKNWNNASEDWTTTKAVNDLQVGGTFSYRMEAKDGSFGFDFEGIYTKVALNEEIAYKMSDERVVEISFTAQENKTEVNIEFDAESENPIEMQQAGWQAILNNFKNYVERSNAN